MARLQTLIKFRGAGLMFAKDSRRLRHHRVALYIEFGLPLMLQPTVDGLFCHYTKLRSYDLRYRSLK